MKNERTQRHSYVEDGVTVGFLTDPTLCIGCKACEVACKEWNDVPSDGDRWLGNSYDHTGALGANSWRQVKFVETESPSGDPRWLFLSDVCKHCENAGCLEACPTGAIQRTAVGSVLVLDDICNGCGYCVVSCPFGVIDRRGRFIPEAESSFAAPLGRPAQSTTELAGSGGAYKCTFCYDRQFEGKIPACANACPTDSILFGPLTDLRVAATERLATLRARGVDDASLYDGGGGSVGGTHALSILVGAGAGTGAEGTDSAARLWGLPTEPVLPTDALFASWTSAFVSLAACALICWWALT